MSRYPSYDIYKFDQQFMEDMEEIRERQRLARNKKRKEEETKNKKDLEL